MSKRALSLILIVLLSACGTGVGNPEGMVLDTALPSPTAFQEVLDEYAAGSGTDCGSFTEASTLEEVDAGRQCIRVALAQCEPAIYLLDQDVGGGDRFVSFVSVDLLSESPLTCELNIHTVSSDLLRFVGSAEAHCPELTISEVLELACGIGS